MKMSARLKMKMGNLLVTHFCQKRVDRIYSIFRRELEKQSFRDVMCMEGEKNGIPVEVAMIYNTSLAENLHSYVNNINTHEGGTHLSGFRRGLTGTLKNMLR